MKHMKGKNKLIYILLGIVIILVVCIIIKTEPTTIGKLAYDANKKSGYTVYIKEQNEYIPYLVLTNNYNNSNNALLLRKDALNKDVVFSKSSDTDNDYYADSQIDDYLNSEYYNNFSKSMKNIIVNSKIQISGEYPNITNITNINRKIFILSCTEVNIESSIVLKEGTPLKYFNDNENKICKRNGLSTGWWLRSNYIPERSLAWCISSDGTIGGSGVQYSNGVRPAFCIASDTKIMKKQLDSSDTEVYVLDIEG